MFQNVVTRLVVPFCFAAAVAHTVNAGELSAPQIAEAPKVAAASGEGEAAMRRFLIPEGFQVEMIAAEPHLANPVSFYIDNEGRIFVTETFRHGRGVIDIRGRDTWLDEDLAARTVEDRMAMIMRHEGTGITNYTKVSDRVKLLVDNNGDGKVDTSTVFADGFNTALDGIGAGVLARKGDVWFANIPNLWLLRDLNKDGVAEWRDSLHYGYGVRVGFLGHDLHGLTFGPDGKIYFTVGDRGASVGIEGNRVGHPDSGSVFRCNPDGSDLEVFSYGLRNPQELAFDDFGNLFTIDNNSDGGDRARLTYLAEGGDSGWRVGYQFNDWPNARGPWNREKLWHPRHEGQSAHHLAPLTNMTDGPSGITHYPGVGLPEKYRDHFFVADFHGGRGSGVMAFTLKPNGAAFALNQSERFIWEALPTDVDFGVDGGIYFVDWVEGWSVTGKGRVYRVYEKESATTELARESKRLLMAGLEGRRDLLKLLGHAHKRVRQEAQFELAARGAAVIKPLVSHAKRDRSLLGRVHALWAIGQITSADGVMTSRDATEVFNSLMPLLRSSEPELRAQTAKLMGDSKHAPAFETLVNGLNDPSARVRYHSAMSLGKLGRRDAIPALYRLLSENADADEYLRHAAVHALVLINDVDALTAAVKNESRSVRLGALLALRRLERSEIARFLDDADPFIVTEATRAINDLPITGAMFELAMLGENPSNLTEPALFRTVNANFRVGIPETAKRLVKLASASDLPEINRVQALHGLSNWQHPSGRDRITGLWRPVTGIRDPKDAREALAPAVTSLLQNGPVAVRAAAAQAAGALQISDAVPALSELAQNESAGDPARIAALQAMAALNTHFLDATLTSLQESKSEAVRKEVLRLQASGSGVNAIARLRATLASGTISEKQTALSALAKIEDAAAEELLIYQLDALEAGKAPRELLLDIVEAAMETTSPTVKQRLEQVLARSKPNGDLGEFGSALYGGNGDAGRKLFVERADVACLRCHKVTGEGGEVGPDLTGIGARQTREYLLESLILPNKHIAAGFETLIVETKSGTSYAGILKSENAEEMVINSPEDGLVTVKMSDVESRERGLSSMPEGMGQILSKQDLRNLVEYLASLK